MKKYRIKKVTYSDGDFGYFPQVGVTLFGIIIGWCLLDSLGEETPSQRPMTLKQAQDSITLHKRDQHIKIEYIND